MPLLRFEHLRHILDEAEYLIAQNSILHIPDHMADRRRGMAGIYYFQGRFALLLCIHP